MLLEYTSLAGAPLRACDGKKGYCKHVSDRIYRDLDIPVATLDDIMLTHTPGLKVNVRSRIYALTLQTLGQYPIVQLMLLTDGE